MRTIPTSLPGGTWTLGNLTVTRLGYGAMQLAGPGVMGAPTDRDSALAVLREAPTSVSPISTPVTSTDRASPTS